LNKNKSISNLSNSNFRKMKILSNDKINYIYHLADIHIRNSTDRKEEYEKVFDELYDQLSKEEKGLIVICGDIYHAKSQLSSESLIMFHRLMRISELMPILILAGNHDGSTTNNELKDSIEGSVHMYPENVHYLDETGLYKYGDLIFSAKHFFDDKPLIKASEIIAEKDEFKIALFHGALQGAKYDNGQEIDGEETINISTFDGFDMTLLGDIHKYQTFKNESIAYSSSLIQQNFGEHLNDHGYIKWYINEPKMEFKRIKNDYGYITLKINEGKYEKKEYPKNIRIRIFYKNTTKEQLDKILVELSIKYNIIQRILIEEKDYSNITNMGILLNKKDLYDKMIDKYMKINLIDADIKDEIKEILHKSTNYVHEIESKKYEIKRLEISNILSFGENNVIDFTKFENLIGIFAQNFSGKSSIIDCITEILYNTNSKNANNKDLIRFGQKSGFIKILINLNGIDYEISRKYTQHGVKIDFYEKETEKKLNADDNTSTMEKIKAMFPDYAAFSNIHCMLQREIDGIADLKDYKRMEQIIKILGINDTQKLREFQSTQIKLLTASIKDNEDHIKKLECNENDVIKFEQNIKLLNNEIFNIENEIEDLNKNRFKIKFHDVKDLSYDTIIKDLEKNQDNFRKDKIKYKTLIQEIKIHKLDDTILIKFCEQLKINDKNRSILYGEIRKLIESKYEIKNYPDNLYEKKEKINSEINSINDKILNLEKEIKIINTINYDDINIIQDKITLLEKIKNKNERLKKILLCRYNDNCDVCVDNNKEIILEKNILIEEIKNLQTNDTYEELIKDKNKLLSEIDTNMKNEKENTKIIKLINNLEVDFNKKEYELEKINLIINDYEKNKQKIEENKNIDDEISLLKEKINLINDNNEDNEEYKSYIRIKDENEKNKKILDEYHVQINNLDKNIDKSDTQIKKFKDDKILYEKNIIKLDEIKIIDKKINDLYRIIKQKKDELEKIKDKLKINLHNKNLRSHFNNLIEDANKKLKIAKVLEKAYDNNGFTKLIINEIIPNMEQSMSRITGTLCDYTVEIDEKLEIYLVRGHIKYKIGGGSGSEKLIVNIAFRLWMVEYGLTICKSSMMMIDESFNSFDIDRRLLLPLIIEEILKRYDKILIISHMEELKNLVKKTIKIKKINDISTIY
jgi:hypothetical protein